NPEPRTPNPLPVHAAAELEAASLDDAARRVIARPDRFVHREDRGEVRQVEDLHERLDPGVAIAESAGDPGVKRLHGSVILRWRGHDGDREIAAAGERNARDGAVESVERSDADAGTRLEGDADVDVVRERVRAGSLVERLERWQLVAEAVVVR